MQPSETNPLNAIKGLEHRDESLSFSELALLVGRQSSRISIDECATDKPAQKRTWAPTADENAFEKIVAGR